MSKPPPKPTFGTISRERILKSGKLRCHICGRESANPPCRKCRKAGW